MPHTIFSLIGGVLFVAFILEAVAVLAKPFLMAGLFAITAAGAATQALSTGSAAPNPTKILADGSTSIWIIPCSDTNPDLYGPVTVEARDDRHAARATACYLSSDFVSVIWSRGFGAGGPDVIVLGQSGGSAAWHVPVFIMGDVPEFDAFLGAKGFNGAYGADTRAGRFAVAAQRDGFVADLRAMVAPPLMADELQRIRSTTVADLHRWAMSVSGVGPRDLSTPDTLGGLLKPYVFRPCGSGARPSDRAGAAGTGPTFKAEAFWDNFCPLMVSHPLWKRFDLDRLPHADLVTLSAREGHEGQSGRDYLPAP